MSLILKLFLLMSVLLTLGSCATPQTASEFRTHASTPNSYGKVETLRVNKSYNKMLNSLNKLADQCLHKRVESYSSTGRAGYNYSSSGMVKTYTPTITKLKNKAVLQLQMDISGSGNIVLAKTPEKGMFILVADIFKAGKNKTKVKIYYNSSWSHIKPVVNRIKAWMKGKSKQCPNLEKF